MSKTNRSILNILETRVLWIISRKPMHGYALLKQLNYGRQRKINNGTLYPILQKLLRERMILIQKTGKREKKTYAISKKGQKALNDACLEVCSVFGEIFSSFMCKKCGTGLKVKIGKVKD